jgi:hypothetical protein
MDFTSINRPIRPAGYTSWNNCLFQLDDAPVGFELKLLEEQTAEPSPVEDESSIPQDGKELSYIQKGEIKAFELPREELIPHSWVKYCERWYLTVLAEDDRWLWISLPHGGEPHL